MDEIIQEIFRQGLSAQREGKLDEAQRHYQDLLKKQPGHLDTNNNLALILHNLGKLEESEKYYKKVIKLNPDYAISYNNLGNLLSHLKRLDEAEANYKKAIKLKPDYAQAYFNLGFLLSPLAHGEEKSVRKKLREVEKCYKKVIELEPNSPIAFNNLGNLYKKMGELKKAEVIFKKTLQLKPNYAEAHNNFGNVLTDIGKLDKAIISYKKALKFQNNKTNNKEFLRNLNLALKYQDLLLKISENRNSTKKNKLKSNRFHKKIIPNPFIVHRSVEPDLVSNLYKIDAHPLDTTFDARFGSGTASDFFLFKNNNTLIKNVKKDLIRIMSEAVKSEIYLSDSFFNISRSRSGITSHNHLSSFDKNQGLVKQKYSLQYYIDIGDQNCSEPGILQLYNPEEEILPSKGKIVIIEADRLHSAVYNGKKDRVMIGVNFYSLL